MTASNFARTHRDRIEQYHRYWNLRFSAIPVDRLDGLQGKDKCLLHRSLAIPGDLVGSRYYIARLDGSWAWVRVSDHWGPPRRFSLNGGLRLGKYPVTQAGYIRIQRDGRLDTSAEQVTGAGEDVVRGQRQVAAARGRSHSGSGVRAVLALIRRRFGALRLRVRPQFLWAGRREGLDGGRQDPV